VNEIVANDRLGAFCRHTHAEIKGASHGPLVGLTFAVKDIYDVAGHRTGFGSPEWLRTHGPAARTAPVVQRLLDAGAHLVGKTHTDELTWSLTGENAHYGAPVNVNAPGRITSGSSSGSASAVAAGVVDFAIGSDTGGSVRLPASFCGILGMRPTYGRIPLDGVCPLAPSFDTCGWFARDTGVFELVGRTLLYDDAPALPPSRLLIAQDALELAGETVAHALRSALDKVAALVGVPEPVTVGDEPLMRWMDYFRFLQGAEAWACHGSGSRGKSLRSARGSRNALPGRRGWVPRISCTPGRDARRSRAAWRKCLGEELCSRCRPRPASRCSGTQRQQCSTTCAPERCLSCASLAWHGCRKCHCRWRSSTIARLGYRSSPHAATIRSFSNWPAG
jgi:hypothetical protein